MFVLTNSLASSDVPSIFDGHCSEWPPVYVDKLYRQVSESSTNYMTSAEDVSKTQNDEVAAEIVVSELRLDKQTQLPYRLHHRPWRENITRTSGTLYCADSILTILLERFVRVSAHKITVFLFDTVFCIELNWIEFIKTVTKYNSIFGLSGLQRKCIHGYFRNIRTCENL